MLDSNIKYEVIMINCKTCGKFLTKARAEENMTACIRCSKVQPYSAHIVYPHKTGAFVQPVTQEQKQHIQRLDRRAVKTSRKVKSGSSSWDRWYKKYQEQKLRVSYNGNTPASKTGNVGSIPSTRAKNDIKAEVLSIYKYKGYYSAVKYVNGLYSKDDITLMTKSSINNDLTFIQSHNKKQRRILLNEVS